jgi:hypothetical protein
MKLVRCGEKDFYMNFPRDVTVVGEFRYFYWTFREREREREVAWNVWSITEILELL